MMHRPPRQGWLALLAPERPDSAARRHLVAGALFLVVSAALGLAVTLQVASPGVLGPSALASYGRLRPAFTNGLIFGWLGLAGFGALYYLTPRLTGVRLWNERLANANLWLSVVVYAAGMLAIGLGYSDGMALLEFPWWLDPLVAVTLAVPAVVVTGTVARRREPNLYVSLWYLLAAPYWGVLLYAIGSVPGLPGAASAIQNWFSARNLIGMWLAGLAVGAIYYVVPKASGNPLYSHTLALIGFWSLAFGHVWTGQVEV
ncbi:MAG: cbb3-type cytochrome c oxidase subunit I, partial [Actinomycetota bacterium]|nr:cbb3-type cytochrome c oxidase subunit I [Actinomycetota bacterium]